MSGVSAKCEIDITYCHASTPRAKIFRDKQGAVQSVRDVQQLLQYNQYATDRNSKLDSCRAIACRKDLEPAVAHRSPFGAIDAKVNKAFLFNPYFLFCCYFKIYLSIYIIINVCR